MPEVLNTLPPCFASSWEWWTAHLMAALTTDTFPPYAFSTAALMPSMPLNSESLQYIPRYLQ